MPDRKNVFQKGVQAVADGIGAPDGKGGFGGVPLADQQGKIGP